MDKRVERLAAEASIERAVAGAIDGNMPGFFCIEGHSHANYSLETASLQHL